MKKLILLVILVFASPVCVAGSNLDIETSEPMRILGNTLLAMTTAYEQFTVDQRDADITKLTVSISRDEGNNFAVLFWYWHSPEFAPSGLVTLFQGESKYVAAVAYTVDAKTNKIIKRVYQR